MENKSRKSAVTIGQIVEVLMGQDIVSPSPKNVQEIPEIRYVI
jgi:hypothetical protein